MLLRSPIFSSRWQRDWPTSSEQELQEAARVVELARLVAVLATQEVVQAEQPVQQVQVMVIFE